MRFPVKTGPSTRVQFAQRFEMGAHEGTDIFGPAGAELVAVEDGTIRHAKEKTGGFAVYLKAKDGTQYYYAHLDAFAHPMPLNVTRQVQAGDVLGYLGTSGNARGTSPHVHFEWRPGGGSKRDPFPMLQRLAATEETRLSAPVRPASPKSQPVRKRSHGRQRNSSVSNSMGWVALLGIWYFATEGD